jgi:hypothetical protein
MLLLRNCVTGKHFGIEDVYFASVRECLDLQSHPLTDIDPEELQQQCTYD